MSTALMRVEEKTIIEIEQACDQCNLVKLQTLSPIRRTLALAQGMQAIRRNLVGPLMADIKALQDTPLGFLTDRGPNARDKDGKPVKPYGEEVIRDCVIEGMLRGASIVGNELNVISSRCYLTKQYFERQVREWPGLTDLEITDGVPSLSTGAGGALVPMRATWKLNGAVQELACEHTTAGDYRIPVRVNAGMGADAILGKARRKFLAKLFARLTGSSWIAEQADMDSEPAKITDQSGDAPEPATTPKKTVERTPAEIIFLGIEEVLNSMEQLLDVDAYQKNAATLLTEEDDLAKLNEWCEWRRQAIRDGRGERANGKG